MAYEYEDKINEAFFTASRDGRNVNGELLAELQEVYNKAKAFDEVVKKTKTEFVSEDLADSIRILVNDYEYDMEDK